MTVGNGASAKAQPLAVKGAVAGLPATAAVGARQRTRDLAPRRAS